jgi:hypothetical protein
MGGLIQLIIAALGFALPIAGGQATSEVLTDIQSAKAEKPELSGKQYAEIAVQTAKKRKWSWIFLTIGLVVSFLVGILFVKPLLKKS